MIADLIDVPVGKDYAGVRIYSEEEFTLFKQWATINGFIVNIEKYDEQLAFFFIHCFKEKAIVQYENINFKCYTSDFDATELLKPLFIGTKRKKLRQTIRRIHATN